MLNQFVIMFQLIQFAFKWIILIQNRAIDIYFPLIDHDFPRIEILLFLIIYDLEFNLNLKIIRSQVTPQDYYSIKPNYLL